MRDASEIAGWLDALGSPVEEWRKLWQVPPPATRGAPVPYRRSAASVKVEYGGDEG